MAETRYFVMSSKCQGNPKPEDFTILTKTLPDLKEGEFLCEAAAWSVDPCNRAFMRYSEQGTEILGFQVAKVVQSKSTKYPAGVHVVGLFGWRTRTLTHEDQVLRIFQEAVPTYILPDISPCPVSVGVGLLGMPGLSAYFGLQDILKPRPGQTLIVNAAAGAVGSSVAQIAKIKGCKVIAYAGAEDKCDWLKSLGLDHVFNYKKVDLADSLRTAAPNGVDLFFDNVGGKFAVTVINHLSKEGRVCLCGAISMYNAIDVKPVIEDFLFTVTLKRAVLKGFEVSKYTKQWPQAIKELTQWIREGKLQYKEWKYKGLEKLPEALLDQMLGKNLGKVVVEA